MAIKSILAHNKFLREVFARAKSGRRQVPDYDHTGQDVKYVAPILSHYDHNPHRYHNTGHGKPMDYPED